MHGAGLGLIPRIQYGAPSLPGMIPEHKARSKLYIQPGCSLTPPPNVPGFLSGHSASTAHNKTTLLILFTLPLVTLLSPAKWIYQNVSPGEGPRIPRPLRTRFLKGTRHLYLELIHPFFSPPFHPPSYITTLLSSHSHNYSFYIHMPHAPSFYSSTYIFIYLSIHLTTY